MYIPAPEPGALGIASGAETSSCGSLERAAATYLATLGEVSVWLQVAAYRNVPVPEHRKFVQTPFVPAAILWLALLAWGYEWGNGAAARLSGHLQVAATGGMNTRSVCEVVAANACRPRHRI